MQINGFYYTSLTTTPSNTVGASSVSANLSNAKAGANSADEQSVAQDSCQFSAKANADSANGIGKAEPSQDIRRLRILHLNDLHGAALPEEGRLHGKGLLPLLCGLRDRRGRYVCSQGAAGLQNGLGVP